MNGEQKQAVCRMQDYIDANLTRPITLVQLARVAGYSPYHAARLFKQETGVSPFEYIRRLRLSGSAMMLCHGQGRIIDVALDFVFDSHEGFTRAFAREFGISPLRYRKNPPPVRAFMPERLRGLYRVRSQMRAAGATASRNQNPNQDRRDLMMNDLEKNLNTPDQAAIDLKSTMNDAEPVYRDDDDEMSSVDPAGDQAFKSGQPAPETVFVQVIERPARKLILKRGVKAEDYFSYCEEVGCDIWNDLTGIKDALYEPAGFWLPESLRAPGTSEYVQGVEVASDYNGPIPEGFEIIDLPPCQVMLFQGPPFDDDDFENAIGNLWDIMDRYDPTLYGYQWADDACPRFQLEPQGYRGYIEGRPVKKT